MAFQHWDYNKHLYPALFIDFNILTPFRVESDIRKVESKIKFYPLISRIFKNKLIDFWLWWISPKKENSWVSF